MESDVEPVAAVMVYVPAAKPLMVPDAAKVVMNDCGPVTWMAVVADDGRLFTVTANVPPITWIARLLDAPPPGPDVLTATGRLPMVCRALAGTFAVS